jgi:uncharacterized protein
MLPDALRESMAGAGVTDDEPEGVHRDSIAHDGVESDSLQEAPHARVATLADSTDPDDQFPSDPHERRTRWQPDVAPVHSGGNARAPFIASIIYLILLACGIGYLAFAMKPPAPKVENLPVTMAEIGGLVPEQPAPVEPPPDTTTAHNTTPDHGSIGHETPDQAPPEHPDTTHAPVEPPPLAVVERDPGQPPSEPLAALQEPSEFGPLPRIAEDGRRPWQVYSRTVPILDNPKIAIVMSELGLDETRTRIAIDRLPADVSLAFHPYAPEVGRWVQEARVAGHESLLAIPMEPLGYPRDDPGPNALLVEASLDENRANLHKSLGAAEGYVGVTNFMGSALMSNRPSYGPVLSELADRGLMFIDSNTTIRSLTESLAERLPLAFNRSDRQIDAIPTAADIDEQLVGLEQLAKVNGQAIGFAQSYPLTFQRLEAWMPLLKSKGIDLVPVSALIRQPPPPRS